MPQRFERIRSYGLNGYDNPLKEVSIRDYDDKISYNVAGNRLVLGGSLQNETVGTERRSYRC